MKNIKLYVIPASITGDTLQNTLREEDLAIIKKLDTYIVETAKVARRHLSGLDLEKPIQEVEMFEVNEHTKFREKVELLDEVFVKGVDVGLMSDAGAPSIADPGWRAVEYAQKKGIKVIPISGPSSILMALMASGLNGQRFVFHGYLSKEQGVRIQDIKNLERDSLRKDETQIFMDTPYKNDHVLQDLLGNCNSDTYLCIAQNVMSEEGFVVTKTIQDWRKEKITIGKVPTLFLVYVKGFKKQKRYGN